jgi:hypothetical protein
MNLDPKQIVEYVKESSEIISFMQQKVASLENEKKKLSLKFEEKEATDKKQTPIFTEEQVRPVMEKLAKAKRIKDVDAATERILEDPSGLLLALDKMAADLMVSVPKRIGSSVNFDSKPIREERESDKQFEDRFLSLSQKL